MLHNNNHFEISNEVPGLVLCRRLVNSDTISYALIAAEDLDSISDDLPEDLEIEGIGLERRKYLYDNIRQFTQTRYQGLICPNSENVSVTPNVIHFDGSGDHNFSKAVLASLKSLPAFGVAWHHHAKLNNNWTMHLWELHIHSPTITDW